MAKRRTAAKSKPKEDNLTHVPDTPISLGEEGSLRWIQFCDMLIDRGQLSSGCFASLEQLCLLYDHCHEIDAVLSDEGVTFINYKKLGPDDVAEVPQAHPLMRERIQYMSLLRGYLNDFGFVPKSNVVPTSPSTKVGIVNRSMVAGGKDKPFD